MEEQFHGSCLWKMTLIMMKTFRLLPFPHCRTLKRHGVMPRNHSWGLAAKDLPHRMEIPCDNCWTITPSSRSSSILTNMVRFHLIEAASQRNATEQTIKIINKPPTWFSSSSSSYHSRIPLSLCFPTIRYLRLISPIIYCSTHNSNTILNFECCCHQRSIDRINQYLQLRYYY